jgi:3-hydroxypropanoate dehydrogenase
MSTPSSVTLAQLFTEARTANGFLPRAVPLELLHEVQRLAQWGPTSMNCQPLRIVFLTTQPAKERLRAALSPGNLDKTLAAPVVAILAHDLAFHERLPQVFPHKPDAKAIFDGKTELLASTAFRNGTLQAAYFMLAARALGLDCGPMSGFNNAAVDAEFFTGSSLKSNFLLNLGYADASKTFARSPRLAFGEMAQVL